MPEASSASTQDSFRRSQEDEVDMDKNLGRLARDGNTEFQSSAAQDSQASPLPNERTVAVRDLHYLAMRCIPERRFFHQEAEFFRCRERLIAQLALIDGALLDYCLTPNEIRLVIKLPIGVSPGRLIQELSGWLRGLNRRDGLGGHVLAERTRSQPIESVEELRRITCWLARYPVDQHLATTPSAYRHSAHRSHLGLDPASGLAVRLLLSYFGDGLVDGREQLRRTVRTLAISADESERLRRIDHRRQRSARNLPPQLNANALLGITESELRAQIAANVEREICAKLGVSTTSLFATPTPRGAALPRSVVVHVLANARVLRIVALARRYRRAPQTLTGEMHRHKRDPALAPLFNVDLEGLLGPNAWERVAEVEAAKPRADT